MTCEGPLRAAPPGRDVGGVWQLQEAGLHLYDLQGRNHTSHRLCTEGEGEAGGGGEDRKTVVRCYLHLLGFWYGKGYRALNQIFFSLE